MPTDGIDAAEATVTLTSPIVGARRSVVIELAAKYRLPACYELKVYVRDGGLLSYGVPSAEYDALTDRWVTQIVKVLRGTPTADIPVELPSRFELCINAKVAQRLGITIPLSLRSRADEIIDG